MIPVKLSLQNFLCYGSTELAFRGIHTACLIGNNGNGKSALLDAITWSLWGQARGVEKNGAGMDDLVRLGCEEMSVEFSFELDGQEYRVMRKRDKRRQVSSLELQVKAGETYRSLTGDRLSETQDKIIQVLKMDYETFVNSAFILQGKADTFTTQKAADRKRILGEILGLSYYERLERRARDKMNQVDAAIKGYDRSLEQLAKELAREPEVRVEWESVKAKKLAVDISLQGQEAKIEKSNAKLAEMRGLAEKKQELEERAGTAEKHSQELALQAEGLEKRINSLREILTREAEIAAGFQELQEVQGAEEDAAVKQVKDRELWEKRNKLEQALAQEKAKLEGRLSNLRAEKSQQEKLVLRAKGLRDKAEALGEELKELVKLEEEKLKLQEEIFALQREISAKESSIKVKETNLSELRERFKTMQQTGGNCPLCNSELGDGKREAVLLELKEKGSEQKAELEVEKQESLNLRGRLKEVELKFKSISSEKKSKVETELELARRDLVEGEEAEKRLTLLSKEERELSEALDKGAYGEEIRVRLDEAIRQAKALNYDPDRHQDLRVRQKELRVFAERYRAVAEAKANLPESEGLLNQLILQRDRELSEAQNHRETAKLLATQLKELPQLDREHTLLKEEVLRLRQEKSKLEASFGALEQDILHLDKVKKNKVSIQREREDAARRKGQYSRLVAAFGKNGIQAMIIENAVPELQEEANNLLARMTDGRMHLALITQRDTKKGSVAETLDIRIADELGTRKYEMFSGGEAFRVNFALRIALSKLLARRAGAKLQTLVVDEGFGTQDNSGRDRLVEVINSIKDEFARIIIITHIQELKDAFPVQIEVEKTVEGSGLKFA